MREKPVSSDRLRRPAGQSGEPDCPRCFFNEGKNNFRHRFRRRRERDKDRRINRRRQVVANRTLMRRFGPRGHVRRCVRPMATARMFVRNGVRMTRVRMDVVRVRMGSVVMNRAVQQ